MKLRGKDLMHTGLMIPVTLLVFWLTAHCVPAQTQSAQAEFETGVRFNTGTGGVTRDPVQAAQWFRKSAEQGYAPGESAYADCLRDGSGVRQDGVAARAWYAKAVAQGNAFAEAGLGYALEQGIGGPRDMRQAYSWYLKAANQGFAWAQYKTGDFLERGTDVPQDPGGREKLGRQVCLAGQRRCPGQSRRHASER